ncbi:E3 ubiquitin-protein ligase MIB2 [Octopus bimaculoides]|uniref:Uncharacterized protein n=1 Tax=Octopus bimaculoides TaxID=37653 RepID=A0A0L8FYY4_OCTBM|nr:E3 ubiquitin-protein ligase MIB2 [Octopus bimaculoides]|eukprot:XP_014785653.1 PREDICTED: E3 ubiquitin-protein ligase MIB2-like [Octopus bimaculoides]
MATEKITDENLNGDIYSIVKLINETPDKVHMTSESGKTYLMAACEQGSMDLVKLLIKAKAFLDVTDKSGKAALHYAMECQFNQQDIVALLITSGACINIQNLDGNTPLHVAVERGSEDLVKVILNKKGKHTIRINQPNKEGYTPLHLACERGNKNIVQYLLGCNADVNVKNREDATPLSLACKKDHPDTVCLLLQMSNPDCNVVYDDKDNTPLHWAIQTNHYDMALLILSKHMVKFDTENKDGMTPLLLAVSEGHLRLIQQFISKGANINAENAEKENCLHYAVKNYFHSEEKSIDILDEFSFKLSLNKDDRLSGTVVACYLAHSGADFYHENDKKEIPLDHIADNNTKEKIKTLFPQPLQPPSPPRFSCKWCNEDEPTTKIYSCKQAHLVLCNDCFIKTGRPECTSCQKPLNLKRKSKLGKLNCLTCSKEES